MYTRLLFLLSLLSWAGAGTAADAAALLAAAKAASGGSAWDSVAALAGEGRIQVAGLSGSVSTREDLQQGRSVARFDLGLFKGANGYDGSVSWNQDPGGEVARQDAESAQRQARTTAWLTRRGYWFAQRGAAQYAAPESRTHAGRDYDVVTATPAGGDAVELWIARSSGRIERTVTGLAAQDRSVATLSDWREVDGLQLPFRQLTEAGAHGANQIEIAYTQLGSLPAVADTEFAVPETAAGARITDASGVTRIPFRLVRDHIHVKVEVDGKPLQMLVDTGGVNILLPAAAKRLGLRTEGKLAARGVGEQSAEVNLARAGVLQLGAVRFDKPLFYVIDFGQLPDVEGEDFDGVIGYELFQRFGVTIDYAARELVLARPDRFVAPAGATPVPFTLADRIPIVQGLIDGLPARISVDTGSGAALDLHSPFVRRHGLKRRYDAQFEQVSGWGVGGPLRAWPVRLGRLELGGFRLPDVAASLYTGDKGAFASPDVDANLGGRVLGRFTVAFDYTAKVMHLAPNADIAKPFRSDRSGLMLLRDGKRLRIHDVTARSPAAAAGLAAGDQVTAIDGIAVDQRSLSEWRDWLAESTAGTRVALAYERSGRTRTAQLVLRDLIPVRARLKD